jgi:iron complex outermembrane receptor protein
MMNLNRSKLYKGVLLGGCATALCVASPSYAQQAPNAPGTQAPEDAAGSSTIVVTGSRIARQDYEANSPIVTIDEALLEQSSTAAIEQNLNRLPQFTTAKTSTNGGGDIQPTATNTPGAATISLRGLGANRNLVLLDGRRATPSNAAGVVDINTIPSAAIERVEIISGGASATYGADAVSGVTNFILKKNFQGLELDGSSSISQEGDSFEYTLSGIMGSDFADGRGNVSIAMSLNTRKPSYQRDRDWYTELWQDPNVATNRLFVNAPGVTLPANTSVNRAVFTTLFPGTSATCVGGQPIATTIVNSCAAGLAAGFNVYANQNGSLFTVGRNQQGGQRFFTGPTLQGDIPETRANGALNFVDTNSYLVLPLTRYNMLLRGNFELNDNIGVFGQGLFNKTSTSATQQGGSIVPGWDVFIPYGSGRYTGSAVQTNSFGSFGIPSSVILNGMNLTGLPNNTTAPNSPYVDPTPGNLADNPTNPAFAAGYADQFACANVAANPLGGCTNNQLFGQFLPADVQTLLNARSRRAVRGDAQFVPGAAANQQPLISAANDPLTLFYNVPENRSGETDVTTYELIAGLEGKVPGTDWTWEVFAQHGATETFTKQTGVFSLSRLRTLLTSPQFGTGFNTNSNLASPRVNFGASFGNCTSGMNFFTTSWENISDDCKQAITADLKNRVVTTQSVAEANVQGGLFELPAGELRFAAGASYRDLRFQFINDTLTQQGASFLDQAVGIYPSQDVDAGYNVSEAYGELLIPVLHDLPFVELFNLEVGGRMSKYDTTGTSWTYKILGDWQVTDWLRFRGGYNRAERSPNAAELYLAPSQTVTGNATGDICSQRSLAPVSANAAAGGNTAARAADILAVCSVIMDRTGGSGTAADYYVNRTLAEQPQGASGFAWVNQVGNPNLKPETANTWTAGAVINSPFTSPMLSRIRLSVDWWNIKLNDAIGVQAPEAAHFSCLDPTFNPLVTGAATNAARALQAATTEPCSRIRYDPNPTLAPGTFDVTFLNAGRVDIAGIDAQIDWGVPIGPGTLTVNALVNYYLHYKSTNLPGTPMVDYAGTLGPNQNALNPGAFRYRSLTTIGYGIGGARLSLQWQHLPSVDQAGAATFVPSAAVPTYNFTAFPSYDLFNLNASYEFTDDFRIRFGIDNLLNTAPPRANVNTIADLNLGQLPGGGFNSNFYDVQGRRFYLGATVSF